MDYSKIYIELMERAADRIIDGYTEKHHIVPKCMGGDDKPRNIAILTAEEHYLAHQLLVKIYPHNRSLIHSANMMGATRKGSKSYAWLRKKHAKAISESLKGRSLSMDHCKNISIANTGRKMSDDFCKQTSIRHKGKVMSEESRKKMSDSRSGIKDTEETKLKKSEASKIAWAKRKEKL